MEDDRLLIGTRITHSKLKPAGGTTGEGGEQTAESARERHVDVKSLLPGKAGLRRKGPEDDAEGAGGSEDEGHEGELVGEHLDDTGQKDPDDEIIDVGEGLDIPSPDDENAVTLPVSSLKKHVAILGASGSGKTVMSKVLIEEALIQGIPSIIIDPQGDLASLAMLGNKGKVEANGTSAVSYANYLNHAEVRIFTPASSKGIPLSINPLKTPPGDISKEDFIKALDLVCDSIVEITGYKLTSNEGKAAQNFLYEFLKAAWQSGTMIKDFSQMSAMVVEPAIVGLEDPTPIITDRERLKLAKNLNYLSIGMDQLMFNYGMPVDIGAFLTPRENGRVPINIIYLNTLASEEHKQFFVAMIAREIYSHMLQHPSNETQLLFLMDEIAPYLPPHPRKPPAKEMLKLLFKQGRKYGVSCVMCTQNPADVDYKAMSQANTWALGRMMTRQDLDKVKHILRSGPLPRYSSLLKRLPQLKPGEFILIAPDAFSGPREVQVRYLITEHITLDEDRLAEFIPPEMKQFFEEYMVATADDPLEEEIQLDHTSDPPSLSSKSPLSPLSAISPKSLFSDSSDAPVERRFDGDLPKGSILMLSIQLPQNEIIKEGRKRLERTLFFRKELIEGVKLGFEPIWRVGFNAEDYVGWIKIPIIGKKKVQHHCVYFSGRNGKLLDMDRGITNSITKDDPIIFSDIYAKNPFKLDFFESVEVSIEVSKDLPADIPRFSFNESKVRRKLETAFGKKPDRVQKLLLPVWEFTIKEKELKQRRTLFLDAVFGKEVIFE